VTAILVFLGIVLAGAIVTAQASHRLAVAGEFDRSRRIIRRYARVAGLAGAASLWATLGWPFKAETVTAWEEVTRPVDEVVDEAYQDTVVTTTDPPWWKFWQKRTESAETVVRHHQVPHTRSETERVSRSEEVQHFSWWLVLPMAITGLLGYRLVFPLVRFCWKCFG
jgi:hypothetical protein